MQKKEGKYKKNKTGWFWGKSRMKEMRKYNVESVQIQANTKRSMWVVCQPHRIVCVCVCVRHCVCK